MPTTGAHKHAKRALTFRICLSFFIHHTKLHHLNRIEDAVRQDLQAICISSLSSKELPRL